MFEGNHCRYFSASADQQIQRSVGSRSIDEFFFDMMVDAASPEQFDALAFQFLCVARRIKRVSGPEYAKAWKTASKAAASAAADARIRLAANHRDRKSPRLKSSTECAD